jgi:protocatechuate 3,4-dioxygenase beta subunit
VQLHDIILGERTSPAEQKLKSATRSEGYRIAGRITDAEEKPVQDASVSVLGRGLKTQTDAEGHYTLGLLAPGNYTLQVQKDDMERTLQVAIPDAEARAGSPNDAIRSLLDIQL